MIIDPNTNQPIDPTTIPVSYPLNQFLVGQEFKIKRRVWRVADIRNRIGMILTPTEATRTESYWTVGELIPLKKYWFRVAIVGREGFVLQPKQAVGEN
jgi:hypothetical protein